MQTSQAVHEARRHNAKNLNPSANKPGFSFPTSNPDELFERLSSSSRDLRPRNCCLRCTLPFQRKKNFHTRIDKIWKEKNKKIKMG